MTERILYRLVFKDVIEFWEYNNNDDSYNMIAETILASNDTNYINYDHFDKVYEIDCSLLDRALIHETSETLIATEICKDVTSEYIQQEVKAEYTNSNVNHPSHYTDGKIEVIDYIEDKKFDYCLGNAIKYISRAGKKNPDKTIEDLEKAVWYIQRRIKQLKGE